MDWNTFEPQNSPARRLTEMLVLFAWKEDFWCSIIKLGTRKFRGRLLLLNISIDTRRGDGYSVHGWWFCGRLLLPHVCINARRGNRNIVHCSRTSHNTNGKNNESKIMDYSALTLEDESLDISSGLESKSRLSKWTKSQHYLEISPNPTSLADTLECAGYLTRM